MLGHAISPLRYMLRSRIWDLEGSLENSDQESSQQEIIPPANFTDLKDATADSMDIQQSDQPYMLDQHYLPLEEAAWGAFHSQLPDPWKWDIEYQEPHSMYGDEHGAWTCTPSEIDEPRNFPLTIAGAPLVIPVERRFPPFAGVKPDRKIVPERLTQHPIIER